MDSQQHTVPLVIEQSHVTLSVVFMSIFRCWHMLARHGTKAVEGYGLPTKCTYMLVSVIVCELWCIVCPITPHRKDCTLAFLLLSLSLSFVEALFCARSTMLTIVLVSSLWVFDCVWKTYYSRCYVSNMCYVVFYPLSITLTFLKILNVRLGNQVGWIQLRYVLNRLDGDVVWDAFAIDVSAADSPDDAHLKCFIRNIVYRIYFTTYGIGERG